MKTKRTSKVRISLTREEKKNSLKKRAMRGFEVSGLQGEKFKVLRNLIKETLLMMKNIFFYEEIIKFYSIGKNVRENLG